MTDIVTFGCRLNLLESEAIRGAAEAAGLADAFIVNSCAVTGEAVRQARQTIRRAKRAAPDRKIIVTGCAAQIDAAAFAAMPEVDLVLGNEEKLDRAAYRWGTGKVRVGDIMAARHARLADVTRVAGKTRAFVQVQNGCDHRCTFCVIPLGRGNSRSVPTDELIAHIRRLVEAGLLEVVLTGVDLTAYGGDLPEKPRLGTLVRRILAEVPALKRLRLSSVDSVEIDDDLIEAVAHDERLMPHLHLSLQSGDDMILKRMKRRHSRRQAIELCARLRRLRPDIVFGADLIAGFPTESDAMFEASLALVEECDLTHLHIFPFSPRPQTPAARMPQLDRALVKERAERLREAGAAAFDRRLAAETGAVRTVLVEAGGTGHTEHFLPVSVPSLPAGTLVPARISGRSGRNLLCEPLAKVA